MWRAFRGIAKVLPGHQSTTLSFSGPVTLLVLVAVWGVGLSLGGGLILHPKLGTSIRLSGGAPTPTDFMSATYAAANSMTIVGVGDFAPQTTAFRLLYLFNSLVGMCMISLTLTYFMQVYSALQRRNTAAIRAHLATDETGDAAEVVAGLGPEGNFENALTRLSEMAGEMANVKETHHFYSLLMYFRFREAYYSVTRLALVMVDTVSLIKGGLDDRRYAALKESAPVQELWRATMHLLTGVGPALLPRGMLENRAEPDQETRDRWRRRYHGALRRFRQAGIETIADEEAGAEVYLSLRARWDPYIMAYAEFIAFEPAEIDPVGNNPETVDDRQAFRTRLRSAG